MSVPFHGPWLVLGCGRAGLSAAEHLVAGDRGAVCIWDEADTPRTRSLRPRLAAQGIRVELGRWDARLLEALRPGTVVKSPGLDPGAPPVAAACRAGIPVVDELELGWRGARRELVAVTGTDGKSTVCALLARALGAPGAPVPVAGNTETGPPLSALAPEGETAVVEVSSYQLQFSEPRPRLAVLTNLSPEHLGRFGSLSRYVDAKRRLFLRERWAVPVAVLHADSEPCRRLGADLAATGTEVITFGRTPGAAWRVREQRWDLEGATVGLETPHGALTAVTRLPGPHNADNAAAALAAADALGVGLDHALAALATEPGVPGRWECVSGAAPFDVIVDFAHTPAGLEALLATARQIARERESRLHLVLGINGATGTANRVALGRAAGRGADRVVVTETDDLGGERPERVMAVLARHAREACAEVDIVPERRAAIRRAIADAACGDLVLLHGRGAEARFKVDGPPFDDRAVAREELARALG